MSDLVVHVLIPDRRELVVCDLGQFLESLTDGEPLDVAMEAGAIDTIRTDDPNLLAKIEKVRALNETGDANAYWGFDQEGKA
jgi:hypothetical protein